MEFISLIFRLGVVLAIFSFIWGLIRFGLTLLRGGMPLPYPLALALKLVQYFLIADITILFCTSRTETVQVDILLSGFILLVYFIGKMQNLQTRFMFVQIQGRGLGQQPQQQPPNMNLELGLIALSMGLFIFLVFKQEYAYNPLSIWFYENITDIEKTPIFGFIFKVIGFFFTITILFRMVGAFTLILSGQAFQKNKRNDGNTDNRRDDERFDDYEEL